MKFLAFMNSILIVVGFASFILWGNRFYDDSMDKISLLSENLSTAQDEITKLENLRDELASMESRIVALRDEVPAVSRQVANASLEETNKKIDQLQSAFANLNNNVPTVDLLPDGMIELQEGVVYDLMPDTTFVVGVSWGGDNPGISIEVNGKRVGTLLRGQMLKVGSNMSCNIAFISARIAEDRKEYATIRKQCV